MDTQSNYDVIIIGSGIGSLTAASLLAQLKQKRVLILEQHFKLGGFTHVFKRNGEYGQYLWDVGLHYVGGMKRGEITRALFDYVSQGKIKWNKMPDPYDVFIYPDFTFSANEGKEDYIKNLFLTGADAATAGIAGALMGGVLSASYAMGGIRNIAGIYKAALTYSKGLLD